MYMWVYNVLLDILFRECISHSGEETVIALTIHTAKLATLNLEQNAPYKDIYTSLCDICLHCL